MISRQLPNSPNSPEYVTNLKLIAVSCIIQCQTCNSRYHLILITTLWRGITILSTYKEGEVRWDWGTRTSSGIQEVAELDFKPRLRCSKTHFSNHYTTLPLPTHLAYPSYDPWIPLQSWSCQALSTWSVQLLLLLWTEAQGQHLLHPDVPNPPAHHTVWPWPACGCSVRGLNTLLYQGDSHFCLRAMASPRPSLPGNGPHSRPQPRASVVH